MCHQCPGSCDILQRSERRLGCIRKSALVLIIMAIRWGEASKQQHEGVTTDGMPDQETASGISKVAGHTLVPREPLRKFIAIKKCK